MNHRRLFVASCMSIGTAAMVFAIRGDVAGPMSGAFHLTNEQMGSVFSPAFFAFTLGVLFTGNLLDIVGMRVLHASSAIGFILGVALVTLAPHPDGPVQSLFAHPGTTMLFVGFFLFGLSHGLVEGVINPLIATLYSTEKTKKIVACHAWWPAGLIIGGLLALAMTRLAAVPWEAKLLLIAIPAAAYLAIVLSQSYPRSERVVSNVSTGEMWKEATRPMFLLLFLCMWGTAAVEMGPDQWFPRVMGELVPQLSPNAGSGVLFLVYTAGLMFVMRLWGSSVSHKSPLGTLVGSSALAGIGLYWLGRLDVSSSALSDAPSLRILVVDDERPVRETLAEMLVAVNHKVELAGSGQEAVEKMRARAFDFVFTDLAMPEMDGWETARLIRKDWPSVKIVLVTGYGPTTEPPAGEEELVDAVIGKPFDFAQVGSTLTALTKTAELQDVSV
jgi:CheY-like chemotaxis protein